MTLLSHSLVRATDAEPTRWCVFVHGILGNGNNWRTIARRFVDAQPDWGAVLVDLRLHGGSQDFAEPHTIPACAADLVALEPHIPGPVAGVLGHSFGGKVALHYLGLERPALERAIIVDSQPGANPPGFTRSLPYRVLEALKTLPRDIPDRDWFAREIAARGLDPALAPWLAMNLKREGEGFTLRLDLAAMETLLKGYYTEDLWWVLERLPPDKRVAMLVSTRSTVFGASSVTRLEASPAYAAGRITLTHVDAGHWVHVDAPDAVVTALTAASSW